MSGGVDSSVAAALLVQQGYQVIGMMLRLWSEPGKESANRCCTPDAMAVARQVCAKLNIPFYAIDARKGFYDQVVNYFIEGYIKGITPNPCLVCNRAIRWGFLLHQAQNISAKYLATGHYARIRKDDDSKYQLLRGIDYTKDQSYVLYTLDQKKLAQTLFPLGGYTKSEVRQMARDFNLPVAERSESQDLCFVGDGDYRDFLQRHSPQIATRGPIVNCDGQILGQHQGLAFYTIGQRKGLGISASQPLYVINKDVDHNILFVGTREQLEVQTIHVKHVNWVSGATPESAFQADIKIRYKSQEMQGTVTPIDAPRAQIDLDQPLRGITPGQAAVFYDQEVCLGGGIIDQYQNFS